MAALWKKVEEWLQMIIDPYNKIADIEKIFGLTSKCNIIDEYYTGHCIVLYCMFIDYTQRYKIIRILLQITKI